MAFADFGPVSESGVGARNGQERVEYGSERPILAVGEVRRLPQKPPTTRRNRRDQARKNPNRERLGFRYWVEVRGIEPLSRTPPDCRDYNHVRDLTQVSGRIQCLRALGRRRLCKQMHRQAAHATGGVRDRQRIPGLLRRSGLSD